jgi:hypothetical protein
VATGVITGPVGHVHCSFPQSSQTSTGKHSHGSLSQSGQTSTAPVLVPVITMLFIWLVPPEATGSVGENVLVPARADMFVMFTKRRNNVAAPPAPSGRLTVWLLTHAAFPAT